MEGWAEAELKPMLMQSTHDKMLEQCVQGPLQGLDTVSESCLLHPQCLPPHELSLRVEIVRHTFFLLPSTSSSKSRAALDCSSCPYKLSPLAHCARMRLQEILLIELPSSHGTPGSPPDRSVFHRVEAHSDKEEDDMTEDDEDEETEETGGEEEESEGDEEGKQEQASWKQAETVTYIALGDFAAQQAGDLTFKVRWSKSAG